jgi:hypothetical protein
MRIYPGQVDPGSLLFIQKLLPTMSTNTPSNPEDHVSLPAAPEETVGMQSSESELSDPPEYVSDDVPLPAEAVGVQSSDSGLSDPPEDLSDPPEDLSDPPEEQSDLPESSVDEGHEESLDDDTENDPFYRSYHNLPDPESNDSGADASATGANISNTQEIDDDSDPCGNCSAPSSLDCVCDMRYCSQECLEAHSPQHKDIFSAFLSHSQAPRPSDLHYRGILLPRDSRDLRFVWLLSEPILPDFGLSELTPLTEITPVEDKTRGREGGKDGYLSMICWQQDQNNQSLAKLMGRESETWLGTVLVRALVKQKVELDSTKRLITMPVPVDVSTTDVVGFVQYCHLCP